MNFLRVFFVLLFNSLLIYGKDYNCEIIKSITYSKISNNILTKTDSIVIQINNRTGEKYTHISIPYSKNNKIQDLKAWIEDGNGKLIRYLDKKDINDVSAISNFSFYEDNFIKEFDLKHNTYPYRIFYTYTIVYKEFLSVAEWCPIEDYRVPVRCGDLFLSVPINYKLNKYEINTVDFNTDTFQNIINYHWHASYNEPLKDEIYAPSIELLLPVVKVVPINFVYGFEGSMNSWQSYGNWVLKMMENADKLPESEKMKVAELIKGISNKREIVRTLYHYLQDNTRYVNVSIDIGGMKPYPAEYVVKNKYGDCKALSNYMKALLNYVGIAAYSTDINASEQPVEVIKSLPAQQFNHVIITVPLETDTLFLENTSNINPFNYVGTSIQDRDALLIDKDQSRLIHIPALSTDKSINNRRIEFFINSKGNAQGYLNFLFRGSDFEYFNYLSNFNSNSDQDSYVKEYLPFTNFDIINWEFKKSNRDVPEITLASNVNLYNFIKPVDKDYVIAIFPSEIPHFKSPKDRTLPVQIPYPICSTDTLIYNLPETLKLKTAPLSRKISSRYGEYEITFESNPATVIAVRKFVLFAENYSLDQYADFYKFLLSIKDIENEPVILKTK
jgi:hypothetical protein